MSVVCDGFGICDMVRGAGSGTQLYCCPVRTVISAGACDIEVPGKPCKSGSRMSGDKSARFEIRERGDSLTVGDEADLSCRVEVTPRTRQCKRLNSVSSTVKFA